MNKKLCITAAVLSALSIITAIIIKARNRGAYR
jgi:hypothetical protein